MKLNQAIYFILILILSNNSIGYNQESIKIFGKVFDVKTGEPLLAATVSVLNSSNGTITDEKGKYVLEVPADFRQPIIFSHVSFETQEHRVKWLLSNSKIYMQRKDEFLEEVTILAKPPVIPLTDKYESIVDFSIEENRILLLSNERNGGYILKLTDFDGNKIDRIKLDSIKRIESLSTSCMETHFLLSEFFAFQIDLSEDKIKLVYKDSRKKYDQFIEACLDANSNYFYYNTKLRYEQVSEIKGFHRYFEEQVNFGMISDDFNNANLDEEKHYLDFMDNFTSNDEKNSIMTQNSSKDLKNFYDYWKHAALLKSSFYQPVDFHLHAEENSVYIMDHEKHKLQKFTLNGKVVNQRPIQYSKEKNWSGKIFRDGKSRKIYTYFNYRKGKLLAEIDLSKGLVNPIAEFDLSFIEDFKIYDQTIYFTNSGLVQGQEARILKKINF